MSTGMPELGSKISLISKADIRYEGRLFTLDPQECTIALANVRSFGTEDRETQYRVAPQNEVYDYILFRGSDIKDIRVVNNVGPLPNDPAIVQLSVPNTMTQTPAYQAQGFAPTMLGHMAPGLPQYPTYGSMSALTGLPSAVAPGIGLHRDPHSLSKQPSELVIPVQVQEHRTNKDQAYAVLDFITGSRSNTPNPLTRKSPTMDQGVQVNQLALNTIKEVTKSQPLTSPPPSQARQVQQLHNARDGTVGGGSINQYPPQAQREQPPREQRISRERDRDHARDAPQKEQIIHQNTQMMSQRGNPQQQRGGWLNRGVRRGRGRGSMTGGFSRAPGSGQQPGSGSKPKNTLKFENDYDFEQANTEFEELRIQLAKTKIDSEPVIAGDGKVNGESDKKDDSGNETGAGEGEAEEEPEVYYDKSKSFFDNISCEAVERSKGRSQRTDWITECKLNTETFGVVAARRGSYRARGYYNRGNMYRGKYRGGYRSQGGNRGNSRSNNSISGVGMNNSQSRPVQQQSK
ncbi:protein LSM14 homolog B isoform X2 [Anabrus simplex]|uniref:protein LSM14 homolog B isoform X2 n=1 Tax=Anabrus simplex TaxID=316456 RepID=UPI0034DDC343